MSTVDEASGEVVPDNATQPFPNPGEVALDHASEAAGYVERQYLNSPNLQALIAGLSAESQKIENVLIAIPVLDDPAAAAGNASDPLGTPGPLDVTGELVGQSRVLSDGTIASDTNFRTYIALRISRNTSIGNRPQFIAALRAIFQAATPPIPFHFYDLGGMTVVIEVGTGGTGGGPPSSDVIALLNDGPIPRAMAVGMLRDWYDPTNYFAFDEDTSPGAAGLGETGFPSLGGGIAEIF